MMKLIKSYSIVHTAKNLNARILVESLTGTSENGGYGRRNMMKSPSSDNGLVLINVMILKKKMKNKVRTNKKNILKTNQLLIMKILQIMI